MKWSSVFGNGDRLTFISQKFHTRKVGSNNLEVISTIRSDSMNFMLQLADTVGTMSFYMVERESTLQKIPILTVAEILSKTCCRLCIGESIAFSLSDAERLVQVR